MGYVSGTVKHDGQPVENIIVVMKPSVGRPAMAKTNAKGEYNIEYTDGERGTKIGPTNVHVEWPMGVAGAFEIPKDFATGTSTQKFEVQKGNQKYDISMDPVPVDPNKPKKKPFIVD